MNRARGRGRRTGSIRILFLGANPAGTTRLSLDTEVSEIRKRLNATPLADGFELVQEWAVRVTDLQAVLLRHAPDIIHFSGHGTNVGGRVASDARDIDASGSDNHGTGGALVVEDEAGGAVPIAPAALENLLRIVGDVRCVVLNACYSAVQCDALRLHSDCVVGMADSIPDRAAIAFAWSFYQALGFGKSVQTAFDLGMNQIALEGFDGATVPRLVARAGVSPISLQLLGPRAGAALARRAEQAKAREAARIKEEALAQAAAARLREESRAREADDEAARARRRAEDRLDRNFLIRLVVYVIALNGGISFIGTLSDSNEINAGFWVQVVENFFLWPLKYGFLALVLWILWRILRRFLGSSDDG